MWLSTVRTDTWSRSAISRLRSRSATAQRTSASRSVTPARASRSGRPLGWRVMKALCVDAAFLTVNDALGLRPDAALASPRRLSSAKPSRLAVQSPRRLRDAAVECHLEPAPDDERGPPVRAAARRGHPHGDAKGRVSFTAPHRA
jgi:hypothetical protein